MFNKRIALALPLLGALGLVLVACAPAARRSAEDKAAPAKEERTMEVAGLKLLIPEGFLLPQTVPPDPRDPRYGGELTQLWPSDTPSIDPTRTTSYLMRIITSSTYERLVQWASEPGSDVLNIKLVPGLAESWDVSKDGLTYTFKLRKGVKFQNVPPVSGREFVADDVLFSYEYSAKLGSVIKSVYQFVESVDAPDKYTVVYRLKDRFPGFIFDLSTDGNGYIVPREVVEQKGDLTSVMIGTGPFIQDGEYQPKVGVSFKRNPDYWAKDGKGNSFPYLDRWHWRIVPDNSARITAFRTGKADFLGTGFSTPTDVKTVLKTNPNTYGMEYESVSKGSGYMFRLDQAPWNDVKIRRAMSLAINYKELAQLVYENPTPNLAILVRGFWIDSGLEDTPDTLGQWYSYDPEKAKRLLAEAGFPNGLKTTVEFFAYSQTNVALSEALKDYWSKIGVDVELKSMEYTIFRANVDKGSWQNIGYSFAFPSRFDVDSNLQFAHSKGAGVATQGHISDPQLDQWVEEVWNSTEEGKRKELLRKVRERLIDQVYIIPAVGGHTFYPLQPWVRNYQPTTNAFVGIKDQRTLMHAWIDDSWRK